ncbi:MAG TPA: proton-conducting transporter membrane subunit [Kineosporiaceae bacterium]|nr:proton-conducting transporter membrane subunit [Kineosporiaceae bacterium]
MKAVQALDWAAVGPVVAVTAALLLILLVDAIGPASARLRWAHDLIALLGLLAAGGSVAWLAWDGGGQRSTLCVHAAGSGVDPGAASCSYVSSTLTLTLQALVLVTALVCLLLTLDGDGAADRTAHHLLFLTAVAGALALAGVRDLASFVVALELASLPGIGLVALRRDSRGAQAGVTLLLTAVASLGLLLLGTALLLFATGSVHLERIAQVLSRADLPAHVRAVAVLGTLLAAAGVAFKLSAVPFHLWTPDTYAGAPMPIAAFLSVVSKAAGLTAIVVLLLVGLPALAGSWAVVVGIVAALTVTVGNLVALRQTVAVRLLAWSTVAQAGWVLLPLAGARPATDAAVRTAGAASVGYLAAYAVAGLASFAVVVVVSRRHPAGEEHTLEAYRGLGRRQPVAAFVLGFALLCLAGLPPGVVGLVAKLMAVRPLVDAGIWPVALIAAVNVALGITYYLRWAALLVVRPDGAGAPAWRVSAAEGVALTAATAGCLALSVAPQLIAGLLPSTLH